jgi:hypothetical protein
MNSHITLQPRIVQIRLPKQISDLEISSGRSQRLLPLEDLNLFQVGESEAAHAYYQGLLTKLNLLFSVQKLL